MNKKKLLKESRLNWIDTPLEDVVFTVELTYRTYAEMMLQEIAPYPRRMKAAHKMRKQMQTIINKFERKEQRMNNHLVQGIRGIYPFTPNSQTKHTL